MDLHTICLPRAQAAFLGHDTAYIELIIIAPITVSMHRSSQESQPNQ